MAYVSCVGCVLRTIDLRGAHGAPYVYPLKRPSETSDGLLKNNKLNGNTYFQVHFIALLCTAGYFGHLQFVTVAEYVVAIE